MSDEKDLDEEISRQGWELTRQLFVLLRIARTHGPNNEAWEPGLETIRGVVNEVGPLSLRIVDNVLYLGQDRIKGGRENFSAQMGITESFASFHVGSLELEPGYKDESLKSLLMAWGGTDAPAEAEEGLAILQDLLEDEDNIRVSPALTHNIAVKPNARTTAKAIYANTLNAVDEVMESIKISQSLPLKRTKRVMQRLVDQLLDEPSNVMGLTTLRCYDEYTYHHSVNVCVLSLSVGRKMGLARPMLAQLGIASLFHDIGKSRIPIEILNKPTEFSDEEWQVIRRHPVYGVKTLVKLKGADELASRVVTGSFEHHMNYDHSGYPRLPKPRSMSLFGRIIGLSDCYDAMTSARVYNRTAITPERALKFMLNKSGSAFDPVLIKVFVNTVGIFPVGTLLLLDSGELAVVTAAHEDPTQGDRPHVRLITDESGRERDEPEDVPLDDKRLNGKYTRNISRILDPASYGVDVSRYFL